MYYKFGVDLPYGFLSDLHDIYAVTEIRQINSKFGGHVLQDMNYKLSGILYMHLSYHFIFKHPI